MPRYINANKLIQDIDYEFKLGLISREWHDAVEQELNWADSADVVEVKHGEWQIGMEYGAEIYTCSECGLESADDSNFCPNCGADMRERKEFE